MNEKVTIPLAYSNPFGELIGLHFESWGDGESRCALEVTPQMMNPIGVLHGAVAYALADTGMGGALVSALSADRTCTTVEIKMSYFRSVTSGRLACESRVVYQGQSVAFLEATVLHDQTPVARASGTYAIREARQPSGA